ncbi:DUF418 domain-containing protein [Pedobacter sp. MC2016-15]|uniref:DUF418 domain-containing protein n=1 Tax=Pedobacter sp. MC2016-15 TaxID=2994473 RepID=UPI002246D22B|nr:DUF418 domain-containing protein [Pedobacter sp. MC2016-15]MCX2480569.1 DUF418 domain-containing protein [Pedobacter sp. MC2016-15]
MSATNLPYPPVASSGNRINFIDVLRGMAVLGITITNVLSQAQPTVYWKSMNLEQSITGANLLSWVVEMGLFEGPMRGLLSLVFGASFLLFMQRFSSRNNVQNPALIYYKRLFWLFVFGFINAYVFLWPGDILCAYALFALVLYPIRNLSARILIFAASLMLLYGVFHETSILRQKKEFISKGEQLERQYSAGKALSITQKKDLDIWLQFREQHDERTIASDAKKEVEFLTQASYPALVAYCWEFERDYPISGYYAWWDILPLFLIGMALCKNGFILGLAPTRIYVTIAVAGLTIALLIAFFDLNLRYVSRFNEIEIAKGSFADLYQIRRIAQTMAYLSLLLLLYKIPSLTALFDLFIPLGKMSLSTYLLQGLITPGIFLAFGWFGNIERYQIYEVLVFIWIFQLLFSTIWLRHFKSGPFEWLLHSLTWSKIQPFKK